MVTGSHIPDDRNGIKFNRARGEFLKSDEAAMPPLRVGVYQHSAVGRDLLVDLLRALGAEVVALGRSPGFVPVDTEAVRPEDAALARAWAAEYGFDALLSTDGDSDRPLLADEHGEWLRGDVLGIVAAISRHRTATLSRPRRLQHSGKIDHGQRDSLVGTLPARITRSERLQDTPGQIREARLAALRGPGVQAVWCIGCATKRTPRAAQTRRIVSKRGSLPGRRALYSASRAMPESFATCDIPRARAMSPIAAASSAGSFSSRTAVRYAATSSSLFRYSAASNSGSSETLIRLAIIHPPMLSPAQSLGPTRHQSRRRHSLESWAWLGLQALASLEKTHICRRRHAVALFRMPEISRFLGIIVAMFYSDHAPPHFHARYGSHRVEIEIGTLRVLAGDFPPRVLGLLMEWAALHRAELQEDWELARSHAELKRISPLE